MKVYVVLEHTHVLGVFSSLASAQRFVEEDFAKVGAKLQWDGGVATYGNGMMAASVTEHEVID